LDAAELDTYPHFCKWSTCISFGWWQFTPLDFWS